MFSMTLQKLKLLFINKQLTLFIFMKLEQLIQLLTSLAFILWEQLEIEQVYSTPITDGSGTITIAHESCQYQFRCDGIT